MNTILDLIVTKKDCTFRVVKLYTALSKERMKLSTCWSRAMFTAAQDHQQHPFSQSVNSWLKGDCLDFLLRLYCRRLSAYFSSRHHDAKELKPDDSFSVPPAKRCAAYWNCWKDALKDCAELSCAAALRLCCAASE